MNEKEKEAYEALLERIKENPEHSINLLQLTQTVQIRIDIEENPNK